jgi:hypothetical protein
MGRHSIRSSKPVIFPTSRQSSKPYSRCVPIAPLEISGLSSRLCFPPFARSPYARSPFAWRVMRAWWSSRSSKPLPRHYVSGGRFDSYPLRQLFSIRNHFRKEVTAHVARADSQTDCVIFLRRLSFQTQPAGSDAGSASATDPE